MNEVGGPEALERRDRRRSTFEKGCQSLLSCPKALLTQRALSVVPPPLAGDMQM
jgi:hypothetical protein